MLGGTQKITLGWSGIVAENGLALTLRGRFGRPAGLPADSKKPSLWGLG